MNQEEINDTIRNLTKQVNTISSKYSPLQYNSSNKNLIISPENLIKGFLWVKYPLFFILLVFILYKIKPKIIMYNNINNDKSIEKVSIYKLVIMSILLFLIILGFIFWIKRNFL